MTDEFAAAMRVILKSIGEDPDREGLVETPARVYRSYQEVFSGYGQNPATLLKTFTDGVCDELVVVRGIEFVSFCEHHMLPFWGVAHVGYLPKGRIVGLSKLARLVDVFAKRLQVQERITTQVTTALEEHLQPKGSGCVLEARHSCMSCRGARKQEAVMVTSSLQGAVKDDPRTRAEFLQLIRGTSPLWVR